MGLQETLPKDFIKDFIGFIKSKIDEYQKRGKIRKLEFDLTYFKLRIVDFSYSMETGFTSSSTIFQPELKKIVRYDTKDLYHEITVSKEFQIFKENLSRAFPNAAIELYIQSFLKTIVDEYLSTSNVNEETIDLFIKELNNEPIKIKALVRLQGITIDEEPIKLDDSCVLRRITPDDIEIETPAEIPFIPPIISYFNIGSNLNMGGVLELEKEAPITHVSTLIQKEIEKCIIKLNLFGCGGVRYTNYTFLGRSIIYPYLPGGTIFYPNLPPSSGEILKVYAKDYDKLKKFWKEADRLNLDILTGTSEVSEPYWYIQVAYQRYNSSLFSTGVFEERTANAVFGLEALYSDQPQEISRFLRLRVSQLLRLTGLKDPYKVKEILEIAYNIRSSFVHGSKADKRKLQNKFASEDAFLREILDCLRLSIIIFLALNKKKDDILTLIDDSFIDGTKEQKLERELKEIAEKFGLKDAPSSMNVSPS